MKEKPCSNCGETRPYTQLGNLVFCVPCFDLVIVRSAPIHEFSDGTISNYLSAVYFDARYGVTFEELEEAAPMGAAMVKKLLTTERKGGVSPLAAVRAVLGE